jgi:hypothetical protein
MINLINKKHIFKIPINFFFSKNTIIIYVLLFFVSCKTEQRIILHPFSIADLIEESKRSSSFTHKENMPLNGQYIAAGKYLKRSCTVFLDKKKRWPKSYKELQYYTKNAMDLSPLGTILFNGTPSHKNLKVIIKKKDDSGIANYTLSFSKDRTKDIIGQLSIERINVYRQKTEKKKNTEIKVLSIEEKNINSSISPYPFSIIEFLKEAKREGGFKDKPLRQQYLRCEKYIKDNCLNFLKDHKRWPHSYKELNAYIANKIDMSPLGIILITPQSNGKLEIEIKKIEKKSNKQIVNKIIISKNSMATSQLEVIPYQ